MSQEIAQRLEEMFITMLSDNQKAREEDGEGNYHLDIQTGRYAAEFAGVLSMKSAYSRCPAMQD